MKHSKTLCCGLALSLLLTLCGCQGAPDSAVVSKNDGSFDTNVVQSATEPSSGETDQNVSWHEQFSSTDGSVSFTLDAQTVIPSSGMPVVEVAPHFLTSQDIQRAAYTIFGEDVTYYEKRPTLDDPLNKYSKQDIQSLLSRWSQYTSQDAINAVLGKHHGTTAEEVKGWVEKYTKYYEKASETIFMEPCKWKFQTDSHYFYSEEDLATADTSEDNIAIDAEFTYNGLHYLMHSSVRDRDDFKISHLTFRSDANSPAGFDGELLRVSQLNTAKPAQETVETIRRKVNGWLKDWGVGDWQIDACEVSHYHANWNEEDPEQWLITVSAVPVFEGAPAARREQLYNLRSHEVYASNYYLTDATFTFNGEGVLLSVDISAPVDLVRVVNGNAATLSPEELLARAKEQLSLSDKYQYGIIGEEMADKLQAHVNIERIEYGLNRVKVPNTDDSYYYVPGIVFWGSSEIVNRDTNEQWDSTEEHTMLILNAIDGSVIDCSGV